MGSVCCVKLSPPFLILVSGQRMLYHKFYCIFFSLYLTDKDRYLYSCSYTDIDCLRDIHTAFNLPYVYDYITKLCRKQAEVIRNHENEHVHGIG
jgi:hypothetical protein